MPGVDPTRSHMPCPNQNEEVCRERRRRRAEILRRTGHNANADGNGDLSWRSLSGGLVLGGKSTPLNGAGKSCPPMLKVANRSSSPKVGGLDANADGIDDVSWRSLSGGLVLGGKSTPLNGAGKSCPPMLKEANRSSSPKVGGLVKNERDDTFGSFPSVGAVAIAGRQREMEDAVTVKTNLCSPVINGSRPVHFFGVYDGHGGSHFSVICKEKMHTMMEEELMGIHNLIPTVKEESGSRVTPHTEDGSVGQDIWRRMFTRAFFRTEQVAMKTCGCGNEGLHCSCDRSAIGYSGSTAVVVVLTDGHIAVANCGDSRAILFRDGKVVPLSFDHKPNREDEKLRIQFCGGHIFYIDIPRVEGILAMTRAIGDSSLKPSVTSEPEVTFTKRNVGDEFVIIASDGLWDVMSNEMACLVTRECLKDSVGPLAECSVEPTSRSEMAANLLTRLALARYSRDNISVVVIDLKKYT